MIEKECILQKFPGKGGWTYIDMPEIKPDPKAPFGWVIVSGSIDGYKFQKHKLLPKGNGALFLPVKAEIRKKIRKGAGDFVQLKLAVDNKPLGIPEEIKLCLENESPETYQQFRLLKESEQKAYTDWIYAARTEETKARRIIKMIEDLNQNHSFHGREKE